MLSYYEVKIFGYIGIVIISKTSIRMLIRSEYMYMFTYIAMTFSRFDS